MKKISLLLYAVFAAFTLSAQEAKQFKLYVFGSEYSGQTTIFQRDVEKSPELRNRLSELDYSYVDVDTMDTKDPARQYYDYLRWSQKKELPSFLVTDARGGVYYIQDKYTSSAELLSQLQEEKLSSSELLIERKDIEKKIRKPDLSKDAPFLTHLFYSPWRIGAEPGIVFSNLAGSDHFTDYKTGYYAHVYAKYYVSRKRNASLQLGLAFNSLGGKHIESGDNLRLNYLSVPLDFEKVLFHPRLIPVKDLCPGDLNLAIGVYGSYLVSDKMPAGGPSGLSKWDAGVRLRLLYHSGSFYFSLNYMRGFMDIVPGPGKGYNNVFQVGLGIALGD